jgi:hypothetical protein
VDSLRIGPVRTRSCRPPWTGPTRDLTLLRLFNLGEPFEVLVTARSQPIPIDAQPTAPPG